MRGRSVRWAGALLLVAILSGCLGGPPAGPRCEEAEVGCIGSDSRLRLAPGCEMIRECLRLPDEANQTFAMGELYFEPARIEAKVGDVVRWVNVGLDAHTATFEHDPRFDDRFLVDGRTGWFQDPGENGTIMLRVPGTYSFVCRFHPSMGGVLVVRPQAGSEVPENPPGLLLHREESFGEGEARPNASVRGGATLHGRAFDPDGGPVEVAWRLDEGAWQPLALEGWNWTLGWNATDVAEGPHVIEVRAREPDGAETTRRRHVTVDPDASQAP